MSAGTGISCGMTKSHCKEGERLISSGLEEFLKHLRDVESMFHANSMTEVEAVSETQDLLHYLELCEQDDETMKSVCRRLKEIRKERRAAKDYILQAGHVVSWIEANRQVIKSLEQVLGQVRKEERRGESRVFSPRTNTIDNLMKGEGNDSDQA